MISHLFPIDFSLLYLSISCPFLLSPENKSKSIGMYCSFLYFCIRKQKKISLLHSDRIRAKYKDVVIQCCASGGRANWGTSYFFPAIAMASHISAVPNHTVFRTTSLKYRIDVAMSGRLGMEIQPKNMTDEEKTLCKKAISEYKEIRAP
jgi:alpha-galactosidase